jgi:hypothetical protein
VPNLRKRILDAGLIPLLCTLGQEGIIRTYHVIQREEITLETEIAKGMYSQDIFSFSISKKAKILTITQFLRFWWNCMDWNLQK